MRRKSVWTAAFALCAIVGSSFLLPLLLPSPAAAVVISSNGNITAQNGTVTLGVVGNESCVQITGTWTGTMSFEGTVDNTNWFAIPGVPPTASTPVPVTSTTANGQWLVPSASYLSIRVKSSAAQTGTAAVVIVNGSGATAVMNYAPAAAGGTVTANQGTSGSSAWYFTPFQGSTLAGGSGGVSNQTTRVVLASDVGLPAGTQYLGTVGGTTFTSTTSFTRPNDTTAYAALDTISDSTSAPTVLTFTGAAKVTAGTGYITKLIAATDQKTCTARLRLHFYYNSAPTAINDNSPFLWLWANRANYIGSLTLPAFGTEDPTNSTGAYAIDIVDRLPFTTATTSSLYAIVETLDAFTPAAQQNFYFILGVEQN